MAMRAIGELARDVVARSLRMAMERGSFEPREIAVVLQGGGAVCGVSLVLGFKRSEVDRFSMRKYPGTKRQRSVFAPEHALLQRAVSAPVCSVLSEAGFTEIDEPVVCTVAIDVVDPLSRLLAGGEVPRQAVLKVIDAAQTNSAVAPRMGAASSLSISVTAAPGNLPVELASFRVVG